MAAQPIGTTGADWTLVLLIWGDKYADARCNRLISDAFAHSPRCRGAVVLTDRTTRHIDPRAIQVPIDRFFLRPEFMRGGLAIKMSLFDLPALPAGAACIYVDLDSAIIGDAGRLADLLDRGPLWTLPTFGLQFSALSRALCRLSGGRIFASGNSSVFAYRNQFAGNPTEIFRAGYETAKNKRPWHNDDLFIARTCQKMIRAVPRDIAVMFRREFLSRTAMGLWVAARLRRRAREKLVVVTFNGPTLGPETIRTVAEGARIADHRGRFAYWTDAGFGSLRPRLRAAVTDDPGAGPDRA